MRRLVWMVVALVLVLAIALPALAAVYKFGTKTCYPYYVGIRSYSTGTTTHFVLEPSYYETGTWNNFSTWTVRTSVTDHKSNVEWGVEVVNGSLSDPGTYGYCTPYA